MSGFPIRWSKSTADSVQDWDKPAEGGASTMVHKEYWMQPLDELHIDGFIHLKPMSDIPCGEYVLRMTADHGCLTVVADFIPAAKPENDQQDMGDANDDFRQRLLDELMGENHHSPTPEPPLVAAGQICTHGWAKGHCPDNTCENSVAAVTKAPPEKSKIELAFANMGRGAPRM